MSFHHSYDVAMPCGQQSLIFSFGGNYIHYRAAWGPNVHQNLALHCTAPDWHIGSFPPFSYHLSENSSTYLPISAKNYFPSL